MPLNTQNIIFFETLRTAGQSKYHSLRFTSKTQSFICYVL